MRTLLLALTLAAAPASAQADSAAPRPGPTSVDVAVLRAVHGIDAPAVTGAFRVVNATAYPVFVGTVPVAGLAALATDGDLDVAVRMGVAEVGAAGLAVVLKKLVGRPRPYVAVAGIDARDRRHREAGLSEGSSFPSGHASIAVALATSLSLSAPEWYVIVPAAAWATTTSVARIWHGVHYPSDVLVGAGIGAASALAVHVLVPAVFGSESDVAAPLRVVIRL